MSGPPTPICLFGQMAFSNWQFLPKFPQSLNNASSGGWKDVKAVKGFRGIIERSDPGRERGATLVEAAVVYGLLFLTLFASRRVRARLQGLAVGEPRSA